MFEAYRIAVRIALIDEVAGPLQLLARYFMTTDAAATKLQTRLHAIKGFFAGGTALMGVGATLAAPLLFAIDKAAELQKQLLAVQIAARGTPGQMDQMRGTIEKVAAQTMWSNIDVAKMAKLIATGTGLAAPQVTKILPVYARFADVQMLMKDTGYQQSVTDAIRLAHTAQHYDAQSLTAYLDLLTKASFVIPGSLSEVGQALKYSQGLGKTALGISDQNMILATALLNRLGFAGSRGGTNLIAALTRTMPGIFGSGLLTGKSAYALRDMGFTDALGHSTVFRRGKFDLFAWMGHLSEYVQREFASHPEAIARQDVLRNFQWAFGVRGARVASLFSSPAAMEQLRQIGTIFSQYGGVESIQQTFANQSVAQQWMNAKTNFVSAMTELGMTLLPTVTIALKRFNTYMAELIRWMTAHPGEVRQYAKDLAIFAGVMLGLGAISIATSAVMGLVTVFGLVGRAARLAAITMGAAATGLGTVGIALKGLSAVTAAATAGYLVGTEIWKHALEGTKAGDAIGAAMAHVAAAFGDKTAENALRLNVAYSARQSLTPIPAAQRGTIERPNVSYIMPRAPTTTVVHTQINMDGKKIAAATTRHITDALGAPQTGTSFFDGRGMLMPAGGI
jgi:hypothetical protein